MSFLLVNINQAPITSQAQVKAFFLHEIFLGCTEFLHVPFMQQASADVCPSFRFSTQLFSSPDPMLPPLWPSQDSRAYQSMSYINILSHDSGFASSQWFSDLTLATHSPTASTPSHFSCQLSSHLNTSSKTFSSPVSRVHVLCSPTSL